MARSSNQKLSSARSEISGGGSQSESGSIKLKGDEHYGINNIKDEKLNAVLEDPKFQSDLLKYYDPVGKAEYRQDRFEGGENITLDWYDGKGVPNIKIGDRFISFFPPELEAEQEQDGYDEYIIPSADGYGQSVRGSAIYTISSDFDESDFFNDGAEVYVWDKDDSRIKDFVLDKDINGKVKTIGGYEVYREKTKREKEAENKA